MVEASQSFFLAILGKIYYHRIFCFSTGQSVRLRRSTMKLVFAEITQEKSCYSLSETGWFPVEDVGFTPPVQAEIAVRKKTNTMVFLEGKLQFTALLQCDRCGNPVERLLKEEFEYTILLEEQKNHQISEIECSDEDCNTLYVEEPVIDLDSILREQVFLAVPVSIRCTEDCRGVCPACGVLMKSENCDCLPASSNSPFAVLERLRKA